MAEIVTQPGYYTEASPRGARGRWKNGNNVRFRKGTPEKIGGAQPLLGSDFDGICRRIIAFTSLESRNYLALATHLRAYIYDDGSMVNVTPIRDSTDAPFSSSALNAPFSSSAGTATITVAHTAHGVEVNDFVFFDNASASPTDGLVIDGWYQVVTVPGSNSYTITHSVTATNSEASFGGASVDYTYEINTGAQDAGVGAGWGGGGFGLDTWGTPRSGSGIIIAPRTWSIDEWGEDVLFCPRGKRTYVFDTSAGITDTNRATVISASPTTTEFIVVSQEDRHLVYLGAHDGSNSDPMLVRWTSQEDYTTLTPAATNTAGDKRLERGSRIVTGIYSSDQIIILTDFAAYTMRYIDYPEVFGFASIGINCGGISPHCAAATKTVVFWMGLHNFYRYDGIVQEINCDVHDHVYRDLNLTQKEKIIAGTNLEEGEIWWLYPSAGSTEIDRYVVYNYQYDFWYYGTWDDWTAARTAWLDKSEAFTKPIAASDAEMLHQHEVGRDDGTSAIPAYVERFDDEVNPGESQVMMISRVILDFIDIEGSIDVTLRGKKYPGSSSYKERGPKSFTSTTKKQNIRMRSRQISTKISCDGLGDHFRLGGIIAEVQGLGNR